MLCIAPLTLLFFGLGNLPTSSILIKALPYFPAALLFAATNAFSEEMQFRASLLGDLAKSHRTRSSHLANCDLFRVCTLFWRCSRRNTRRFDCRIAGSVICQVHAWVKGHCCSLVHPLLPERGHLCLLGDWFCCMHRVEMKINCDKPSISV